MKRKIQMSIEALQSERWSKKVSRQRAYLAGFEAARSMAAQVVQAISENSSDKSISGGLDIVAADVILELGEDEYV